MPETSPAPARRLGTAKQACAIADVHPATLRSWLRQGLISGERIGNGPFRYDLDQVAAMRIQYPCADLDARIREIVAAAPDFTPQQVNRIRLLLHAAPDRSEGGAA
jgi:DNA-binding transcriptional MerR regulator